MTTQVNREPELPCAPDGFEDVRWVDPRGGRIAYARLSGGPGRIGFISGGYLVNKSPPPRFPFAFLAPPGDQSVRPNNRF